MKSLITASLIACALLTGCGAAPATYFEPATESSPGHSAQSRDVDRTAGVAAESGRLIATEVTLTIQTLAPDSIHRQVLALAVELDGYVVDSDDRSTTVRIPSDKLQPALDRIEALGEVVLREVTGTDVTDTYVDLETRLNNAEKTRDRYLALLDKAESINEMLTLERELERINGLIESLKGRLQQVSNRFTYASITVRTSEGIKPGPVAWLFGKAFGGVKWLFVRD
ncbi:DUF4349 domain-containing protein [bacterium]|nr:DUF4349 domain-containing protein [bacterium]